MKEVEHFPHRVGSNPTISIIVVAYQHKNYIQDCLQSILRQKTNFEFEIIIGEDSSSDGTREECIKLAKKYPERIRLFLHHRANNIKIAGRPTGRFNGLYSFYVSNGKYIAICEGDDFWTDPNKLQKQVDFLDNHESFRLVSHNMFVMIQSNGQLIKKQKLLSEMNFDHFALNGCDGIYTCSMLFRNGDWLKEDILNFGSTRYDGLDHIILLGASKGGRRVKVLDDYMATYRVHEGGVWTSGDKRKQAFYNVKNYKLYRRYSQFNVSERQKLKLMMIKALAWLNRNSGSGQSVGVIRRGANRFFVRAIQSKKIFFFVKLFLINLLLCIHKERLKKEYKSLG